MLIKQQAYAELWTQVQKLAGFSPVTGNERMEAAFFGGEAAARLTQEESLRTEFRKELKTAGYVGVVWLNGEETPL